MYKRTNKASKNYNKSYTNRNKSTLQDTVDIDPIQNIPELRRIIEITDFDSGDPNIHRLELYKTDQIACYIVLVDEKPWKECIGWRNILAGISKALPRLIRN